MTNEDMITNLRVQLQTATAALEAAQTENDHLSNLYMCAETITPEGELGITPETVRRELKRLEAAREDGARLIRGLLTAQRLLLEGAHNITHEMNLALSAIQITLQSALSAPAAEPRPDGPSDRDPECDISGQCCASENATGVTNCVHCGKELHQRANGYWYTWDAAADGGLPQSQIVKAKSVAEPQAEHPDTAEVVVPFDEDEPCTCKGCVAARSAGEKEPGKSTGE